MNTNSNISRTRRQTPIPVVGFLLLASVLIVAAVVFAGARWLHGVWQARHALDSASVTLQQMQQAQDVVKWSSFVMRRIGLRELMGLAFVLGFWGANSKTKKTMLFFLGVLCLTALLPGAFDIPLASLTIANIWMPFVLFLFGVFTLADIRVPRNKAAMGLVFVVALACAGTYLYAYYRTTGPNALLTVEQKFTEPWTVFGSMAWKEIAAMLLLLFPMREWIAIGALQERETGFYTIAGFVYGGITLAAFLWLTRGFRQQDLPMLFYLNAFVSLYAFIAQKIGNRSGQKPVSDVTPADGGMVENSASSEMYRQEP